MTLIRRYKRGLYVNITAGALTVRSGEAVLENTNGSKYAFRKNTGDVALGGANIDVGTLIATTYYIYLVGNGAATTAPMMFSTDALAPSGVGTAPYRKIGWFENVAAGAFAVTNAGEYATESMEKILNIVNVNSIVFGSNPVTGTFAYDDTIPQITEGHEILAMKYAPSSATNKIKIEVQITGQADGTRSWCVALFKVGTADALACDYTTTLVDHTVHVTLVHYMTAGTTEAIDFRVRSGPNAGIVYYNGIPTGRKYGGSMSYSMVVTEITS
jgi:hypothetical protein